MGGWMSSEDQMVRQAAFEGKQWTIVPHEAKCLLWLDQTTLVFSLVLGDENYVHIWDLHRNSVFKCKTAIAISHLVLLDDDTFAAMSERQVYIMTKSGEIVKSIFKPVWEFTAMAAMPDGRVIVSTTQNAVLIYSKHGELNEASFHRQHVMALASYGDRVVAGYDSGLIHLWLFGEHVDSLSCNGGVITSLAVIGRDVLFSGSFDGKVRMWDMFNAILLREFDGHKGPITHIVPFGANRVASASQDGTIRVWDTETGACVILEASKRGGHIVALAAFGEQLASCERGESIVIWR